MKLRIKHRTDFAYSQRLQHAVQCLHMRPQSGPTQEVLTWSVSAPGRLSSSIDGQGNAQDSFSVPSGAESLKVSAGGEVETFAQAHLVEHSRMSPLYYSLGSALAEPHPRMSAWATQLLGDAAPSESSILSLASAVKARVRYRSGQTDVQTAALEAFDWGWGVCQDQAHVMVALCRGLGWPARYVSGYFYDEWAPELASHAWVDVCTDIERQHWLSVDVTHACLTDERHVRLAVGRDYVQCSPTRGVRQGGGQERMRVSVVIEAC